ncbi:MAG: ion channel [bacterium]
MSKPQKRKIHEVVKTTSKPDPFHDGYYWLLSISWVKFLTVLAVFFLGANAVFACVYLAVGGLGGIEKLDFTEAFFFSVHTIATVGYGNIHPDSLTANIVVVVEIMIGIFMIATTTGLMFAKFSRPTAKVLFSKVALINIRNGLPCFTFRVANKRGNNIAEAQVRIAVLKKAVTKEGENIRMLFDLKPERDMTSLFTISWMVFHYIDDKSPLHNLTPKDLEEGGMRIIISLIGYDSILSQQIHTTHIYEAKDIIWNARFKDSLVVLPSGLLHLDYANFHEWEESKEKMVTT